MRKSWIVLLAMTAAHAASFNCAKAKTPQEKAICSSPELSTADDRMAAAYKALVAAAPGDTIADIREGQRVWIHQLDATCKPKQSEPRAALLVCLNASYEARTAALQQMVLHAGGVAFVLRSIALTAPAPPPPPGVSIGSGVRDHGYLNAKWPHAHPDSPEWTAWNRGLEAALVKVVSGDRRPPAANLQQLVSPEVSVDVAASLGVVDPNLVTATIANDWDSGGIHPNENTIQFNWLLREQRELKPEDVFRRDSAWAQALQRQCDSYLHHTLDPGLGQSYENTYVVPGMMAKTLHGIVTDPENWQLDAKGLTIIFQTYAVACHACTPAPLLIPWKALRPMLNPAFALPAETCTARAPWDKMPVCK